jgi:hypothetical protein
VKGLAVAAKSFAKLHHCTRTKVRFKARRDFEAKELRGASTRMIRAGLGPGAEVTDRLVVFAIRFRDAESGDLVWGPKYEVDTCSALNAAHNEGQESRARRRIKESRGGKEQESPNQQYC